MDLSVVIPVHNEAENIAPLVAEIRAALTGVVSFEIVYVDDGSTDGTVAELTRLKAEVPELRVLRHTNKSGQSTAVRTGVKGARADWIATLDGDGQNDPADIPNLWKLKVEKATGDRPMLFAGWRVNRQDTWRKRKASKFANALRQSLLKDSTPDTGCGLKLFPRALFLEFPYFDHMHRYLATLTLRAGGTVQSVPVGHRPRTRGVSKYGVIDRALVGITDLMGVMWLQRRGRLPGPIQEL